MKSCNRGLMAGMEANQWLNSSVPPLKARAFELPGDSFHYAPDRPADIQHVKLEITLDFEQESISGTAYTTFSALYEEVRTVAFDAVELAIEQVTLLDGPELKYSLGPEQLIVTLDRPYHYGETFTVAIRYHARPRIGLNFNKPAPEDPTRPIQAWTFGQTDAHKHWFPCHWVPNDRFTSEIIVTVPARFTTVSNGNLLGVTDNGETRTHHWRHDVAHPAYLVSLVVAEFAVVEDHYKQIPLTYYVRPDRQNDALRLMGKTPEMMRLISEYVDYPYPYDKYAQTVIEIYTGAMEHTTTTTHGFTLLFDQKAELDLGDDLVQVVAHELAHQWFGDLLTCRDWSEGWLNEGFATFFEHLWVEYDQGHDAFKIAMKDIKNAYLAEDRHYRRPVVYRGYHSDGFELFDGHLYLKGCWVLHMLRHQLGDSVLRRGLHAYLERNRGREVITADLERVLEEVSGRSLARFFQQWIHQGGYPAFEVSYSWDDEHKLAKVKIKQTQEIDALTPCFVTPVDLAFTLPVSEGSTETRDVQLRLMVGEDGQIEQSFFVPLEFEPLLVRFDPDGWLLKTLAFERSAKMLRYQLEHDPDVLGRCDAAAALAQAGDPESVQALITALFSDPFWGVRSAAAEALGTLKSMVALEALTRALDDLDPRTFSRSREAIARALGAFQAPQQTELAERAANALGRLLERGDPSYLVELAAAQALGQTRSSGAVAQLEALLAKPSWLHYVERGIFIGLAATGSERAVKLLVETLGDPTKAMTLRFAAVQGLYALGKQRYLYSEQEQQQVVTALCEALEHDSWERVRGMAALTLEQIGERRAVPFLEQAATRELHSRVQRAMRAAAHTLSLTGPADQQLRQVRDDLDRLREENRQLKAQMDELQARLH